MTQQKTDAIDPDEAAVSPKELALFVVRAVRENRIVCALAAAVAVAIGFTVVSALPETFDSTSKIFVQDSGMVTSALASGHERYRPIEGGRGLDEFILAHDNLLAIVREAKLVERWPHTRPWPMHLKDQVMEYLSGPPDPAFMERSFVEMLELSITAAKEGDSVRIHAQWRDPQSAYEIGRLVQRNFLSARAAHDLGPIQRAIPFLEQQLQEADQEIESAVSRLQKFKVTPPKEVPTEPKAPATTSGASAAEFAALSARLSAVRREQRALTEPRRQKVAELKLQLLDLSSQYSADHPIIRQQEARIATLSEVPPELSALREEEAHIVSALSSRGVTVNVQQPGKEQVLREDPELSAAQARLSSALRKSDETMARLESARIELATAEADFKHRYLVIEEPDIPSAPLKEKKKPMLFVMVLVATILSGVLAAVLRELRKGRLVESWQVRQLGLDLLGEVELE